MFRAWLDVKKDRMVYTDLRKAHQGTKWRGNKMEAEKTGIMRRPGQDLPIYLFKYLWLIVILPKQAQFFILWIWALLLVKRAYTSGGHPFHISADTFSKLILGYVIIHMLSIFFNTVTGSHDFDRVLAAANTALIWIPAVVIYLFYRSHTIDMEKISKYCLINCIIMIGLAVAVIALGGGENKMRIPFLGRILWGGDLAGTEKKLTFRMYGYLEYATLTVPFMLLQFPLALMSFRKLSSPTGRKTAALLFGVLMCLPIFLAKARMGYVLAGAALAAGVWIFLRGRLEKRARFILIAIVLGSLLILFPVWKPLAVSVFRGLMNMRVGSNSTRIVIYTETLEAWLSHPLIGCGVKDRCSWGYPLGSHCSYLGFLYKSGILGAICAMGAFALKIRQLLQMLKDHLCRTSAEHKLYIVVILLFFFFFILEDMDGADWLLCVWFGVIGIVSNQGNWTKAADR